MRFPSKLAVSANKFTWLIITCLLAQSSVQAAIINPDDIPVKETGDAISAGEFNTVSNVLRGITKDDNGTASLADDRYGLFLPTGVAPTQPLDVNGSIKATYFLGDGSNLTNLPETHWVASGNDINYGTGRVGIGIASPNTTFEAKGGAIRATATNSNSNYLEVAHGGSNAYMNFTGTGNLNFRRSGGDVMTLSQSGRLGIGTTNPQAELHVVGNIIADSISTGGGGGGPITSSQWDDVTGGINYAGGLVGIGVSPPDAGFHVRSTKSMGSLGERIALFDTTPAAYDEIQIAKPATSISGENGTMVIEPRAIPGSGTAKFSTWFRSPSGGAGTTRHNVVFDGNIGINTTTPSERLQVVGQAEIPEVIFAQNNNGATDKSSIVGAGGVVQIHSDSTIDFYESDAGSQKFRFNVNDGRLGVGTTSPQNEIHVMGTVKATNFVNQAGDPIGGGLWTESGSNIYYQAGRVGIGATTAPSHSLDVFNGSARVSADVYQQGSSGDGFVMHSRSGSSYDFWQLAPIDAGTSEWGKGITLVQSNGNVGISNTGPGHRLDVDGNIRTRTGRIVYFGTADQRLYGDNDSAFYQNSNNSTVTQTIYRDKENTVYGRVYGSSNGTNFGLLDGDGNWAIQSVKDNNINFRVNNTERMRITNGGNVGIGTSSPASQLHIVGGGTERIEIEDSSNPRGNYIGITGSDNLELAADEDNAGGSSSMRFRVDASERMRIRDNGNVGINNTSPGHKLDVDGNIRSRAGRIYYFGTADQRIYGDNDSAFYTTSNNSSTVQNIYRDKENTVYGRVYGSGDGSSFGLIEGDGHWGMQMVKDDYTAFRINNSEKMRLTGNGELHLANNHINVASYNFNGTPTNGVKIRTNLPYVNSSQMPTVVLEGYNYGQQKPIGIIMNWYIYNGNFINYKASSYGAYTPIIKLANEGGKVVIYIDDRQYYNRFNIRVYAQGMSGESDIARYEDWTVVDQALTGGNQVTFAYENEVGNLRLRTGRTLNFGTSNQRIYGDNASAFYTNSNNSTTVQNIFRDSDNTVHGRIYGDGNGANFGLIDGDGHWGIRMVKDNYTEFRVNNDEKMRIQTNGNVGINNTAPVDTLHVNGTIRADNFVDQSGASISGLWVQNGTSAHYPTGNVGINNTSPAHYLDVDGNIRTRIGRSIYFGTTNNQSIYGDNSSAYYIDSNHSTVVQSIFRDRQNTVYGRIYGDSNGANFGLLDGDGNWGILMAKDSHTQFRVNDSEKMRITSSGAVGVGTTSPSGNFEIENPNGATLTLDAVDAGGAPATATSIVLDGYEDRAKGIFMTDEDSSYKWFAGEGYNYAGYGIGLDTTASNQSEYGANAKLLINTSGLVGINNSGPGHHLDVDGNIRTRVGRSLYFGTTNNQSIYGDNGSAYYVDSNNSSTVQMIFRDRENGVYGRVYGSGNRANFGLLDGDGDWTIQSVRNSNINFRVNNSEKMRILSNNNVGIGTATPSSRLEVTGVVKGGTGSATSGTLGFGIRYTANDTPNTFGAHYSSGATVLGYGVQPKSGSSGYVSSAGNVAWPRGAVTMTDSLIFSNAGSASVAVGNDVSLSERFRITSSGLMGINNAGPVHHLDVDGNIRTRVGRSIYFGTTNNQNLYGDNSSAIYLRSNHDTVVQQIFRDRQNTVYGRIYGDGNGANFGLLDNDGQWAIRHTTDSATRWYINNTQRMHLSSGGNLGIGVSGASSRLEVAGDIEFSGTIKTSSGEVRCPTDRVMVGFNTSGIICEFPPQLYQ